ncbi:MAG: tetratricopeptide repeat protein [Acidobacteriota bacterium]
MTYPGNPELSAQAQERVMSAFRQVVTKIQDGLSNEALIGLEFVLRLDPTFAPGVALQEQLIGGQSDIDLSSIISHIEAPDTDTINLLLIEAVEDFNQHNYLEAKERVEKVLIDLPGHAEARSLAAQIDEALKVATQVGQFLTQAKEALADNRPQDAANFVLMAQALDPHHSGIEATLAEIHRAGGTAKTVPVESVASSAQPPQPPATPPPAEESIVPPEDFGTLADDSPSAPLFQAPADEEVPAESGFAISGGFSAALSEESESDSWDVAGAFEEPASQPNQAPVTPPEPEGFELGGNVADLFEVSSDASETPLWEQPESPPQSPAEETGPVEDLLAQGTAALEAGNPQDALHHLSRILLTDPENSQAAALIDKARSAVDAMEHQLQASLSEAEMAWDSGDQDRARKVVEEILVAAPNNEDAQALKVRFTSQGPDLPLPPPPQADPMVPPPPESAPGLEEDPDRDITALHDFDSAMDQLGPDIPAVSVDRPAAGGSSVPWRWIVLGGGAVAVVLVGMWLGSSFLPQRGEDVDAARAVSERIENAQILFDQGKGEEALDLLRSFDVEGIDKQRIDKHITRFEAALIPPTPTPIPESVEIGRSLMENGQWVEAFQVVNQGLSKHPGDAGLLDLKEQIALIEPRINALFNALAKNDFQTGADLAGALVGRHPDQEGLGLILDRCLFNAALNNLRSYNLTGARGHLKRLQERHPDDSDVVRILDFISSYTNRPVDMQLEIFVGSLGYR